MNEKNDLVQQQEMEKLQEILQAMKMPQIKQELEDMRRCIEENSKDVERQDILKWLSEVYFEDHHNLIKSNRHPGSGEWLFKKGEFISWKECTESSILWLHGFPGAGKTNLVSAVIDQFIATRRKMEAVAHFYCKYDQDPSQIMRAIVKQLSSVEAGSKLSQPVKNIYKKRKDGGFTSGPLTMAESESLLIEMTANYESTFICIDALDECD
ncbi:hypothetical protein P167DRAFT_231807 [Morchella conica CCBAS932]|uniref:Nephrocystin 3-like N-terminal domain-containing protein n=1 Tax=Morchella conica CCBAS932 TaxID=1392247 RepID=A0A3N4KKE9_9PEZI|nr:hypothetical protein P167DRAFT_231807 [Morchella conica CCBAS932]